MLLQACAKAAQSRAIRVTKDYKNELLRGFRVLNAGIIKESGWTWYSNNAMLLLYERFPIAQGMMEGSLGQLAAKAVHGVARMTRLPFLSGTYSCGS